MGDSRFALSYILHSQASRQWIFLFFMAVVAVSADQRVVSLFIPPGGERWSWRRRCRQPGRLRCVAGEEGSRTSGQMPVVMRDVKMGNLTKTYGKGIFPAGDEGEETGREVPGRVDGSPSVQTKAGDFLQWGTFNKYCDTGIGLSEHLKKLLLYMHVHE